MSRRDEKLATRLFHCARALTHALDERGWVPMDPAGFTYEQETVVFRPSSAPPAQLCIAPELRRPGTVRDVRATCYEAAMCLRSHIEGADALEKRLLGIGDETDRESAWNAWLENPAGQVPEPDAAAYGGLDAATDLLRTWTQRDPEHRKVSADGLHALPKAILAEAPGAAAQTPEALASRRIPPLVLFGSMLLLGGVLLGMLLMLLISRGDEPSAGTPSSARPAEAPALEIRMLQSGSLVGSWTSTLEQDRVVVPSSAMAGAQLEVQLAGSASSPTVDLWPEPYWSEGEARRPPQRLPGPALLRRTAAAKGWDPFDAARESVSRRRLSGSRSVHLALPSSRPLRDLRAWTEEHDLPLYCLALDEHVPGEIRLLARVLLDGGRTLDICIPLAPPPAPRVQPPRTDDQDEPTPSPADSVRPPADDATTTTKPPATAPEPTDTSDRPLSPDPGPDPAVVAPTQDPTPGPSASTADRPTPTPAPDASAPATPAIASGRLPLERAVVAPYLEGENDPLHIASTAVDRSSDGSRSIGSSTVRREDLGTGRLELEIGLPGGPRSSGRKYAYVWPKRFWQPMESTLGDCTVREDDKFTPTPSYERVEAKAAWRLLHGTVAAWVVRTGPHLSQDAYPRFRWTGPDLGASEAEWLADPSGWQVLRPIAPRGSPPPGVLLANVVVLDHGASRSRAQFNLLLNDAPPATPIEPAADDTADPDAATVEFVLLGVGGLGGTPDQEPVALTPDAEGICVVSSAELQGLTPGIRSRAKGSAAIRVWPPAYWGTGLPVGTIRGAPTRGLVERTQWVEDWTPSAPMQYVQKTVTAERPLRTEFATALPSASRSEVLSWLWGDRSPSRPTYADPALPKGSGGKVGMLLLARVVDATGRAYELRLKLP